VIWEGLTPPYSTIVADPPWHYEARVIKWGRRATMPYSTMSLEAITAVPVAQLAAPWAHLYLWTTNRYLRRGFDVAESWGFDPITTLVWCKTPVGKGPGGQFSVTTEFVLFCRRRAGAVLRSAREAVGLSLGEVHQAVRGGAWTGIVSRWELDDCLPTADDWRKLQRLFPTLAQAPYPEAHGSEVEKVTTTWFRWQRGRHSEKPSAFGDLVEQVSPGPYVELFARAPRLGWDSWGYGYEGVA
jgi:N6-adenosine-specific RNA methylase IME4